MSAAVQVWRRDIEIALEALQFRAFVLDEMRQESERQGLPISQEHVRKMRETHEAMANLRGRLAKTKRAA